MIGRILLFLAIAGVTWLIWEDSRYDVVTTCTSQCTITSVGGCDKYGECGVSCTQGGFPRAHFPVVGQTICTTYTTEWKDKK